MSILAGSDFESKKFPGWTSLCTIPVHGVDGEILFNVQYCGGTVIGLIFCKAIVFGFKMLPLEKNPCHIPNTLNTVSEKTQKS